MTGWTDERIPIAVAPAPGEALDSWLERYAYRLKINTLDFVDYLGLPHSSARTMVRRLTEEEREVLQRRTGIGAEQLTAMTLEPYDGSLVRIDPSRRLRCPPAWRHYGNTSRYCPACLEEDQAQWQVRWRLGWAFACTRHELLLLDHCPQCGNTPPVASLGRHRIVPRPETCRSWIIQRGPHVRCDFPLAQAPAVRLPKNGLVLTAQHAVDASVLADHHGSSARQRGGELSFLGRRALRGIHTRLETAPSVVRKVLDECGGAAPQVAAKQEVHDAHNIAVGTALAVIATDLPHPSSDELFTWLQRGSGRPINVPRDHPTSELWNWKPAGTRVISRILKASDGQLTLKARLRYATATSDAAAPTLSEEEIRLRAAKLPGMLWPSWTLRLLPAKAPHQPRIGGIRRACVNLMLIPGGPIGHRQAARLMGNNHFRSQQEALLAFVDADHIAGTLAHFARVVDTHTVPIDYARRRTLFADETELALDETRHREICRSFGSRQFTPVHQERARWQLRRLLLGAEPYQGNHAPAWAHRFAYRMHPDLRAFLTDQAGAVLAAHGIAEPVSWEPPDDWLDGNVLPVAPHGITTDRLAALLAPGPAAKDVATELGLTVHQLRLLLESRGVGAPKPPRPRGPGHPAPRKGDLAPSRLRHLYEDQGLQQKDIAELAGCSPGTVRYSLREAGVPLRPRRAAGELARFVSRTWLRTEYHIKGRTAAEIGRELNTGGKSVADLLDAWGIPRHPPGHVALRTYPNPFSGLPVTLSAAMHRISIRQNSLTALRSAVLVPGYPTRRSAALTLSVPRTTFNAHLRLVEDAAGFAVFNRRKRPVRMTPRGQPLIREAQRLIALLDEARKPFQEG
ncbi:TniQ family protein [Streptomyces sp. H10-C2]|uniref:TniQ family protein n=1 Tax=unclassified Streptomyces TaxID=2593676 RepID=UPI0024B87A82|nr:MULTISPECIES: TniQ family protein [unclassified Streptomyces]MDJ0344928.1 TniQ family protein [Streptomyces sp. PH10-H1]MDJ0373814.1 TniQ family protein [Streptomyces sp. H10-C2]